MGFLALRLEDGGWESGRVGGWGIMRIGAEHVVQHERKKESYHLEISKS